MNAEASQDHSTRRSRMFVLGFGAAQAGAFIGFIPLLAMLLPEKARLLAGADQAILLSQVAMLGGLTAAGTNFLFGALSDRTKGRFGRRRPWILGGLVLVSIALALIAAARGPIELILAMIAFQVAMNMLYAPLCALVPDMVPASQKGLVSASMGAALPIANVFTAVIVASLAGSIQLQFAVVAVATAILVAPFAWRLREPSARPTAAPPTAGPPLRLSLVALKNGHFRMAFGSRLLAESAVAINTLYLYVLLQGFSQASRPTGWSATQAFSVLLLVSTLAAALCGFAGGALSDRWRRRRPLVIAGGVAMAAALAAMAGSMTWPVLVAAQLVFGIGHGLHSTAVTAMTAEILPEPALAGRDLGVMNIAIAMPQTLAPALAAVLLGVGLSLQTLFGVAAVAGLAGAVMLAPLRRIR